MKKLLYILAFAFACSVSFTACTEEDIKPTDSSNGGGGAEKYSPVED